VKLKEALLQAMRRNAGVRVTIKNFVAAAELVKHDQAQCFDDLGGRPRAGIGLCVSAERSPRGDERLIRVFSLHERTLTDFD
jgi:hypothetical protein